MTIISGSSVKRNSKYNSDIDIAIEAEKELLASFYPDLDEVKGLIKSILTYIKFQTKI